MGEVLYHLSYIAPVVPVAMAGLEPATSSVHVVPSAFAKVFVCRSRRQGWVKHFSRVYHFRHMAEATTGFEPAMYEHLKL